MDDEKCTPAFRRQLRRKYTAVSKQLHENRQELVDPSHEEDGLSQQLLRVEELYDDVRKAREGALDANVVSDIAFMGRVKSQKICPGLSVFSSTQLTQRVLLRYGEGTHMTEQSWCRLGKNVQPLFKRAPSLLFAHLDDDSVEPIRRQRAPRSTQQDQLAISTVPKQIDVQKERSETSEEVEKVFCMLQGYYKKWESPVDFFEFVVHPTSFGQTVENMFFVSFLLRDGYAELQLDSSDLPVLIPVVPANKRDQLLEKKRRQLIMSITPQEWADIVQTFDIRKPPLIGSR